MYFEVGAKFPYAYATIEDSGHVTGAELDKIGRDFPNVEVTSITARYLKPAKPADLCEALYNDYMVCVDKVERFYRKRLYVNTMHVFNFESEPSEAPHVVAAKYALWLERMGRPLSAGSVRRTAEAIQRLQGV